jgi:two-component system nitrate/nitrite response regulator NarL
MSRQQGFSALLFGKNLLLREGLAKILRAANFRILGSATCASDLRPSKAVAQAPLFLIVHTDDDFGFTLEQIQFLRSRHPDGRIAIVADRYRVNELILACRAGTNAYFVNITAPDRFIKSVELVLMGEEIFPPAFLSFVLDSEAPRAGAAAKQANAQPERILEIDGDMEEDAFTPSLSPREQSILHCLIEGDSNKCIARKIDITEATVKVHVKAILRKIRVQNRTQAAIWGMTHRPVGGRNGAARARPASAFLASSPAAIGLKERSGHLRDDMIASE